MPRVTESTFIPQPIEDVFWDAADPDQQLRWDAGSLRTIERLNAVPLGVGARYRIDFRRVGRVEFEFLEFAPPHRYVHRTTIPFGQMRHTFTFTPEGAGTRMTQDAVLDLNRFGQLVQPLIAGSVRRRMRLIAEELSRDLATRPPPH